LEQGILAGCLTRAASCNKKILFKMGKKKTNLKALVLMENKIANLFGGSEVKRLKNYSFEYSCFVANYLKIKKKGNTFRRMCSLNKNKIIKTLYEMIVMYGDDSMKNFKITYPDEKRIKRIVRERYKYGKDSLV
jgi:hypothetical protein